MTVRRDCDQSEHVFLQFVILSVFIIFIIVIFYIDLNYIHYLQCLTNLLKQTV